MDHLKEREAYEAISSLAFFLDEEISQIFSEEESLEISENTMKRFKKLLPQLPYIGGKENPLTENLLGASYEMGIYEELEQIGLDLEEIARLNRNALISYTRKKMTAETRAILKSRVFTPERFISEAELSQKKRYPGDWIFRCILPGENDHFDFGIEYSSCAIADLYKNCGKTRYLPYICANDYAVFGEMGIFLERTKTIGNGAALCNFRFTLEGKKPRTVCRVRDLEEFGNTD